MSRLERLFHACRVWFYYPPPTLLSASDAKNLEYCCFIQYPVQMQVTVRCLRYLGKKLPDRNILSQPPLTGSLVTARVSTYLVAELVLPTTGGLHTTLATLYEPQLVQVRDWGLILRGIQRVNDCSYLQEWSCQVVAPSLLRK